MYSDKKVFLHLRKAYVDTLKLALPHLQSLLEEVNGKTAISTDHGELLGERLGPLPFRDFGHPVGVHVDTLVKVPWYVIPAKERKTIIPEDPKETEQTAEEEVSEHLRALGYAE